MPLLPDNRLFHRPMHARHCTHDGVNWFIQHCPSNIGNIEGVSVSDFLDSHRLRLPTSRLVRQERPSPAILLSQATGPHAPRPPAPARKMYDL